MDRVISKIRILHDQASTMKQILLLPESLYCKGNNAETKLPAIGIKVADPLMGNRQARMSPEERPIKASLASPVRKNDSRIFDPPEPMLLRTSTRIFQKPQANIFGDEVEGVRRGQFDPRRFETHFNVFNPSEALVPDSPPKSGKKLIAVNPNLTSHMAAIGISAPPPENDVDCFKPSRKLVADPTAKPVEEREEIYKPSRKLFQEVLQTVAEPEEETFVPGLKQFNRVGQPTHIYGLTGMEQEIQRSPIKGNGDWRAEGRKPRGNESQFSISGESPKSAASAITGSRPSSRWVRD